MLYTLRTIVAGQKASNQVFMAPQRLCSCVLLALELGRHRTVQSHLDVNAQDWLLTLENSVCGYLVSNWVYANPAVSMYLEAYIAGGMDMYRGCYPFHMLDEFLHLILRNENLKQARIDDMLKICSQVLLDLQHVLENYRHKLPGSRLFETSDCWTGNFLGGLGGAFLAMGGSLEKLTCTSAILHL